MCTGATHLPFILAPSCRRLHLQLGTHDVGLKNLIDRQSNYCEFVTCGGIKEKQRRPLYDGRLDTFCNH
jgi:hypothetical protein